jgi:spore coat protein A, manganese oxidase
LQSSTSTMRIERFGQTGDKPVTVGDWDGDGKADPSVYRDSAVGSQSYFYYRGSLNNPSGNVTYIPWGTTGDKPMRGDFDGDGKVDPAVFRNGVWYINQSSNNQLRTDYWGLATDKFVPADYDGDGKTDLAVFRNGVWYVKQSSDGLPVYYNWGLNTDTLVPADYDGDGKTDAAVNRSGIWYIRQSSNGNMSAQIFGLSSDVPVPSAFVQ